jgi:hypothetical protein
MADRGHGRNAGRLVSTDAEFEVRAGKLRGKGFNTENTENTEKCGETQRGQDEGERCPGIK